MQKSQPRHYVYLVLVLLIAASSLALWLHQRAESSSLQAQLDQVQANQASIHGTNYIDATILPNEQAVYLPLAKLKLPDSALAEGLVYTYTDDYKLPGDTKVFPATLSISTHDLAGNAVSTTQQFDCTEVAYADFVTPSYPVNPKWKLDGSITLSNGKTMHIYYAPSIPGCDQAWKLNNIDSKAIADVLTQAVSY